MHSCRNPPPIRTTGRQHLSCDIGVEEARGKEKVRPAEVGTRLPTRLWPRRNASSSPRPARLPAADSLSGVWQQTADSASTKINNMTGAAARGGKKQKTHTEARRLSSTERGRRVPRLGAGSVAPPTSRVGAFQTWLLCGCLVPYSPGSAYPGHLKSSGDQSIPYESRT